MKSLMTPFAFMLSNNGEVSATLSFAEPNPSIPSNGTPINASPSYSVTAPKT